MPEASLAQQPATVDFELLRYHPDTDAEPRLQRFTVRYAHDLSVLEALQQIKDEQDGSLAYRWSCRQAICGSCGVMVNGKPRLGCETFVRDLLPGPIRVEPLAHFPIARDLVVDADGFVDKFERIKPYLIPEAKRALTEGEYRQTPAQLERYASFSACINCMLCYAACPQYGLNPEFTGPGLLALLHRYNADSRDGGRALRMPVLTAGDEGVWNCTAVGYCSEVCPKGVDPANAVNQNKADAALDYFLRLLPGRRHAPGKSQ